MNINLNDVREHIERYFKENLPQYTVLEIRRKSSHPDDSHLFMVSANNGNGTYAVWSSWNETTQSLNYGHYGLQSAEECEKIFEDFFIKCNNTGGLIYMTEFPYTTTDMLETIMI